jgi:hypothetical protein
MRKDSLDKDTCSESANVFFTSFHSVFLLHFNFLGAYMSLGTKYFIHSYVDARGPGPDACSKDIFFT